MNLHREIQLCADRFADPDSALTIAELVAERAPGECVVRLVHWSPGLGDLPVHVSSLGDEAECDAELEEHLMEVLSGYLTPAN